MLTDEIKSYTQPDGLISPNINPSPDSTGNGLMYLALYHLLLMRMGLSRTEHYLSFNRIVSSCAVKDYRGIPLNGLYYRSPTKKWEMEAWDDYIALSAVSRRMCSPVSWDIFSRGGTSRWFIFRWIFNCLSPGRFTGQSWFGRSPAIPAVFQWSVDKTPPLFRRIAYAVSIFVSAMSSADKSQEVVKTWLMIDACDSRSVMVSIAAAFWRMKTRWAWKTSAMINPDQSVMIMALRKELGDNHPVANYWR